MNLVDMNELIGMFGVAGLEVFSNALEDREIIQIISGERTQFTCVGLDKNWNLISDDGTLYDYEDCWCIF